VSAVNKVEAEESLLKGLEWLELNKARLHKVGCSIHNPSPTCSCGANACLQDLYKVSKYFLTESKNEQ